LVPIAAFLAGALLSILLPVGLLIALSVWYWLFSAPVPEAERLPERGPDPAAADPTTLPGPNIPQTLPPEPGA
jgi:hypothetical protein